MLTFEIILIASSLIINICQSACGNYFADDTGAYNSIDSCITVYDTVETVSIKYVCYNSVVYELDYLVGSCSGTPSANSSINATDIHCGGDDCYFSATVYPNCSTEYVIGAFPLNKCIGGSIATSCSSSSVTMENYNNNNCTSLNDTTTYPINTCYTDYDGSLSKITSLTCKSSGTRFVSIIGMLVSLFVLLW